MRIIAPVRPLLILVALVAAPAPALAQAPAPTQAKHAKVHHIHRVKHKLHQAIAFAA